MFDQMAEVAAIPSPHSRPIVAAGDTVEELLVEWLENVLTESRRQGIVFSAFAIDRLEEGGVQGSAGGSRIRDVSVTGPTVVSVSDRDLAVVEIPDGWWARVYFETG